MRRPTGYSRRLLTPALRTRAPSSAEHSGASQNGKRQNASWAVSWPNAMLARRWKQESQHGPQADLCHTRGSFRESAVAPHAHLGRRYRSTLLSHLAACLIMLSLPSFSSKARCERRLLRACGPRNDGSGFAPRDDKPLTLPSPEGIWNEVDL